MYAGIDLDLEPDRITEDEAIKLCNKLADYFGINQIQVVANGTECRKVSNDELVPMDPKIIHSLDLLMSTILDDKLRDMRIRQKKEEETLLHTIAEFNKAAGIDTRYRRTLEI